MADTNEYKAEIRRSFDLVKPISTEAAAIFYPTLWEVNPSTKVLFKTTDMEKQGEKLMKTLGVAVATLDNMEKLVPILQHLGRQHVSYGVTADMYASVGEALLLTLEKGLGDECTPETKVAWTWVLGVISGVCIEAAGKVAVEGEKVEPKGAEEGGAEKAGEDAKEGTEAVAAAAKEEEVEPAPEA